MRSWVGAVVVSIGLLITSTVAADAKSEARAAYQEGSRLYDLADFAGALAGFRKAYMLFEEPTILFNIAQCHRQLKNTEEAIRFYKTYLRKVSTAPNAVEVEALIKRLEGQLEKERAEAQAAAAAAAAEAKKTELEPPPTASATSAPLVVAAPPKRKIRPWIWGVVAGSIVVVAGVGVGLGIALGSKTKYPTETVPALVYP